MIYGLDPDVFVVAPYLGTSYYAQPTGEGIAEACVSMVYNGIEYSDAVLITVERMAEKDYNDKYEDVSRNSV